MVLSFDAQEFFEEASASLQRKLDRCFEMLKTDPRSHPNIKQPKGDLAGYYRYRVGDYRVVYDIDNEQKRGCDCYCSSSRSVLGCTLGNKRAIAFPGIVN